MKLKDLIKELQRIEGKDTRNEECNVVLTVEGEGTSHLKLFDFLCPSTATMIDEYPLNISCELTHQKQ